MANGKLDPIDMKNKIIKYVCY